MEYGLTTDDPSVWVKPYTVLRPMILNNDFMMLQSGCHEGNYGMPNILSAARADEEYAMRAALEAAAERQIGASADEKGNRGVVENREGECAQHGRPRRSSGVMTVRSVESPDFSATK